MKKIIILLLLFSFSLAWSQDERKTKLEITFQDFFKKDNISLKINKTLVFKNLIITSRTELGLADLDVMILDSNNILIVNKDKESSRKKINIKNEVKLCLTLNGKKQSFLLDLKKGKYIGLSKNDVKAEFSLCQSQHPFEYD